MSNFYKPSGLFCVLTVITLPALAVYGPNVSGRWEAGSKLEAKGDYTNAMKQYEQALAAARKLEFKGLNKKDMGTMRACAVSGSEARLAGARAGRAALKADNSPVGKRTAVSKAQQAFDSAIKEANRGRPELADGCP